MAFHNLYFSAEFREHNFCDFFADGNPFGRIDPVPHSYIEGHLRLSFLPRPEGGLEPYFWQILPFTLSEKACRSYLRTQSLPADERDYYLSKLFQFIYTVLSTRYFAPDEDDWRSLGSLGQEVVELLGEIPVELLPPDDRIDWVDFWWDCYDDARELPLPEVLSRLSERLRLTIQSATEGIPGGRRHGPAPDLTSQRDVAAVVSMISGSLRGDWKGRDGLLAICKELDRRQVPISRAWSKWSKKPTSWVSALAAHKERVVKALEYRLEQAEKHKSSSQ